LAVESAVVSFVSLCALPLLVIFPIAEVLRTVLNVAFSFAEESVLCRPSLTPRRPAASSVRSCLASLHLADTCDSFPTSGPRDSGRRSRTGQGRTIVCRGIEG
jgi:hypothetical protein